MGDSWFAIVPTVKIIDRKGGKFKGIVKDIPCSLPQRSIEGSRWHHFLKTTLDNDDKAHACYLLQSL
eukprot:5364421-Ditylum_brightwellii.AAC.1